MSLKDNTELNLKETPKKVTSTPKKSAGTCTKSDCSPTKSSSTPKKFTPQCINKKRKICDTKEKSSKVHISENAVEKVPQPSETYCNAATVDNVLEDMEEEIGNALERPCYKNKLTPKNVENILRHIISNEYVLKMVRGTMNPSELGDEPNFEPNQPLTRSKAKEMRKKQCSLPWLVASPSKMVDKGSKKLLEEEFPDESSDDEDYKPNEEEFHSDDDDTSKKGTPRTQSLCSSPVAAMAEPMSEDENTLHIALPELDVSIEQSEADKIALRTRSKLCLNDTPLEEIEASLKAPDISMDMYAVHCDDADWQMFLSELNSSTAWDHPDDAENDPDFKPVSDCYDHYERKITADEWNDFLDGAIELAREELSFLDDEEEEEEPVLSIEQHENVAPPSEINVEPVSLENVRTVWMTSDEKLQLEEQMRMHVQLLSQSYLLSHGNPALENLNTACKIILEETKMFASRDISDGNKSCFYAQNLDGALDIVKEFENITLFNNKKLVKESKGRRHPVPNHIRKALASNKVFIYPELLPICGFRFNVEMTKLFNAPEDNLITLGLEQFSVLENPIEYIQSYLLPTKSVGQIQSRIRSMKLKKDPLANSITYYHVHNQAPKFQRVIRIFDPDNVKAPEDYPPNNLPEWMESYSKLSSNYSETRPNNTSKSPSEPSGVRSPFRKPLKQRKYIPILPRGLNFSSIFQSQPFLKKYSRKKPAKKMLRAPVPIKPKANKLQFECQKITVVQNLISSKDAQNGNKLTTETANVSTINRIPYPIVQQSISNPNNKEKSIGEPSNENICSTHKEVHVPIVNNVKATTCSGIQPSMSKLKNEKTICKKTTINDSPKINNTKEAIKTTANIGKKSKPTLDKILPNYKNRATNVKTTLTNVKKSVSSKKDISLQSDLDNTLALLQTTVVKEDTMEEQEVMFANSYLLRATEILKSDPEVYEKFLSTLCKYHQSTRSPVELYSELKEVLKDHPTLVKDFVVFLRPEQAKECGKYKEHIALSKTREFFKKIEVHFKDQPKHINRIIRTFAQLQEQVDITSVEVIKALEPLLKNQKHLLKDLNNLLSLPK